MTFGRRNICCCQQTSVCGPCNNQLELDITSANLYTSSVFMTGEVVGTHDLTNGNDIRDRVYPSRCTFCSEYDRLNDYTVSGGSHPMSDCTSDTVVGGVRISLWQVDLCDDGSITIRYRFTAGVGLFPGFYARAENLLTFTIDATDVIQADLTNGTGVDISNAYVSDYKVWNGLSYSAAPTAFMCSTASLGEPFDSLAGTIKLSLDLTSSGGTWDDYDIAAGNVLENWSFTGMTTSNSDCGTLYINVTGTNPNMTFDFYSDAAKTQKVATGSFPALPGTMSIIEQNSSGLTGSVDVDAASWFPTQGSVVCQSN